MTKDKNSKSQIAALAAAQSAANDDDEFGLLCEDEGDKGSAPAILDAFAVSAALADAALADALPPWLRAPGWPAHARWPASSRCLTKAGSTGGPGVGKTFFARSLAKGLGVPLHVTGVGEWFARSDGALGGVTQAFQSAWDAAIGDARSGGALLLIDEIDAIPDRATLSDRARERWSALLAHILSTTDGAATKPRRPGVVRLHQCRQRRRPGVQP